jgi:hypothetical protein
VKVGPRHPTGLGGRLGTVLRVCKGGLVEVDLDSWYYAGIGLVAFKPDDLVATDTKRRTYTYSQSRFVAPWLSRRRLGDAPAPVEGGTPPEGKPK